MRQSRAIHLSILLLPLSGKDPILPIRNRRFKHPRRWSNRELRKLAPLFGGAVANISAWEDSDKQGKRYKQYFTGAISYDITNYPGTRGFAGREGEIPLDLTAELPQELVGRFDVVFSHTVFEHIFEITTAFANFCAMSKDVAITVVPFAQAQHEEAGSYMDYWRFTPTCLRKLFEASGMTSVYESVTPSKHSGIYVVAVGSRQPEKWQDKLGEPDRIDDAGWWIGGNIVTQIGHWCLKYFGWWPGVSPKASPPPDER